MLRRAFWTAAVVCVLLPTAARAQPSVRGYTIRGVLAYARHDHYPHGPRVAPPWGYPGLPGGPFVGYPPPGTPGYPACSYPHGFFDESGQACADRAHGPFLHHLPVPVYGPLPALLDGANLHPLWRNTVAPGLAGYGWFGLHAASPRPVPPTVSTHPAPGGLGAPVASAPGAGACLTLAVRVPQSGAEVFVDGKKTTQTGTDRTFESPPLEAGKGYAYTVTARWLERGQTVEVVKTVSGTPGETVRVDFGAPAVAVGK